MLSQSCSLYQIDDELLLRHLAVPMETWSIQRGLGEYNLVGMEAIEPVPETQGMANTAPVSGQVRRTAGQRGCSFLDKYG
jgi:hypothetical protein